MASRRVALQRVVDCIDDDGDDPPIRVLNEAERLLGGGAALGLALAAEEERRHVGAREELADSLVLAKSFAVFLGILGSSWRHGLAREEGRTADLRDRRCGRSEEHTSELQS